MNKLNFSGFKVPYKNDYQDGFKRAGSVRRSSSYRVKKSKNREHESISMEFEKDRMNRSLNPQRRSLSTTGDENNDDYGKLSLVNPSCTRNSEEKATAVTELTSKISSMSIPPSTYLYTNYMDFLISETKSKLVLKSHKTGIFRTNVYQDCFSGADFIDVLAQAVYDLRSIINKGSANVVKFKKPTVQVLGRESKGTENLESTTAKTRESNLSAIFRSKSMKVKASSSYDLSDGDTTSLDASTGYKTPDPNLSKPKIGHRQVAKNLAQKFLERRIFFQVHANERERENSLSNSSQNLSETAQNTEKTRNLSSSKKFGSDPSLTPCSSCTTPSSSSASYNSPPCQHMNQPPAKFDTHNYYRFYKKETGNDEKHFNKPAVPSMRKNYKKSIKKSKL